MEWSQTSILSKVLSPPRMLIGRWRPYRSLLTSLRVQACPLSFIVQLRKVLPMAKKAKKIKTKKGIALKIVNPNAAGIDIASDELQVCVPADRDADNNRCFGSYTKDLRLVCEYLRACRIDTVAMESTGVFWVQPFRMLKEAGFDVILVNARQVKGYSEKKTDEADAEWLMLLHSYGLLKASYQPENLARMVRNLSRHRENILDASAKAIQHMQKSMELMNMKLTEAISDITGKSGMAIIKAVLRGERSPQKLAELADPRCKAAPDEIAASLEGTWDDEHLFALGQSLDQYEFLQKQAKACDLEIEKILINYSAVCDTDMSKFVPCKKRIAKKNAVTIDVEKYAYSLWGVNMMQMPGVSTGGLLTLTGELGHNFTEKFESADAFCRWLNLVPNNKISGGEVLSSKVPRRKNTAGQAFRQFANSVKDSKTPLGYYFRRMKAHGGHKYAIVATAHRMAKITYAMVSNKEEYDEKKSGPSEKELLMKKIERTRKALDKLNAKLLESGG